jgi:hypothetical protein
MTRAPRNSRHFADAKTNVARLPLRRQIYALFDRLYKYAMYVKNEYFGTSPIRRAVERRCNPAPMSRSWACSMPLRKTSIPSAVRMIDSTVENCSEVLLCRRRLGSPGSMGKTSRMAPSLPCAIALPIAYSISILRMLRFSRVRK